MLVDIYQSRNNNKRNYVFVETRNCFSSIPEKIRNDCGKLFFDKKIELNPGEKRIALKTDEAISHIMDKGYYIITTWWQFSFYYNTWD